MEKIIKTKAGQSIKIVTGQNQFERYYSLVWEEEVLHVEIYPRNVPWEMIEDDAKDCVKNFNNEDADGLRKIICATDEQYI